eukprot:TRINITY_DN6455_c5_g1_i1.p2 TRINITY_DN6455_c5_g1~~TRINITY_DN6455_c5_g1_i1.p2  ORF type:complete len:111 (-),score=2.52 TRINITY_DN6455_c5_g1_i1:631-963(-)
MRGKATPGLAGWNPGEPISGVYPSTGTVSAREGLPPPRFYYCFFLNRTYDNSVEKGRWVRAGGKKKKKTLSDFTLISLPFFPFAFTACSQTGIVVLLFIFSFNSLLSSST